MTYHEILNFWFNELTPKQWFIKDTTLDTLIKQRFEDIHRQAKTCELSQWRQSPDGRLAEIIVLDQFSRNIYRDHALAFACDNLALALGQEAVHSGADQHIEVNRRSFLYMPYMHSESRIIHSAAVQLFSIKGLESSLDFELKHKQIIDRFGRFPHRNLILNRSSTHEEIEFLKQPGSSF